MPRAARLESFFGGAPGRSARRGVGAVGVSGVSCWRSRRDAWLLLVGLALVLGGALGNLYDRVVFGVVRDMLHLFPGVRLPYGWEWPGGGTTLYPWIFNLADVFLLAGVAVITLPSMDSRRVDAAPADAAKAAASAATGAGGVAQPLIA